MKKKVVLLIYGEGGHKAQMQRLYKLIIKSSKHIEYDFIGISEKTTAIKGLYDNYNISPIRDKYDTYKSFLMILKNLYSYIKCIIIINKKYNVIGIISTGPGMTIPISIFYKIINKKIVHIETWSRFKTKSITGKVMYHVADKFYIQNISLKKLYPKSIYGGLL